MNWFKTKPSAKAAITESLSVSENKPSENPPSSDDAVKVLAVVKEQQDTINRLENRLVYLESMIESKLSEKTLHERVLEDSLGKSLEDLRNQVNYNHQTYVTNFEDIEDHIEEIEWKTDDLEDQTEDTERKLIGIKKEIIQHDTDIKNQDLSIKNQDLSIKNHTECLLQLSGRIDQCEGGLQSVQSQLELSQNLLNNVRIIIGKSDKAEHERIDSIFRWIEYLRSCLIEQEQSIIAIRTAGERLQDRIETSIKETTEKLALIDNMDIEIQEHRRSVNTDLVALTHFIKNQQTFLTELAKYWGVTTASGRTGKDKKQVDDDNDSEKLDRMEKGYDDDEDDENSDNENSPLLHKEEKRANKELSTLCF